MGTMNIVGPQVKRARQEHQPKLTQQDLADRLNEYGWTIDRGGVAKIEVQLRRVTDEELLTLSDALGVSVRYLLGSDR